MISPIASKDVRDSNQFHQPTRELFTSPQSGGLMKNRFKSLDRQNFISLGSGNTQRPQTSKHSKGQITMVNDLRRKSSRQHQISYSDYSNHIYETDKGQYSSFLPKIYDILAKCLHE